MQRMEPDRICLQHSLAAPTGGSPVPVAWPSVGILDAAITGQFVLSFCCAQRIAVKHESLYAGTPPRTAHTPVLIGSKSQDEEYPDLIEEDAKVLRSAFTGGVWDGVKSVRLDLEVRAAASHPHAKQSVFQFVIVDRSSEPVVVDLEVIDKLSTVVKPFFTSNPRDRDYRESTYVFFASGRPSPARSAIVVRNSAGKLLARLEAAVFAMKPTANQ